MINLYHALLNAERVLSNSVNQPTVFFDIDNRTNPFADVQRSDWCERPDPACPRAIRQYALEYEGSHPSPLRRTGGILGVCPPRNALVVADRLSISSHHELRDVERAFSTDVMTYHVLVENIDRATRHRFDAVVFRPHTSHASSPCAGSDISGRPHDVGLLRRKKARSRESLGLRTRSMVGRMVGAIRLSGNAEEHRERRWRRSSINHRVRTIDSHHGLSNAERAFIMSYSEDIGNGYWIPTETAIS